MSNHVNLNSVVWKRNTVETSWIMKWMLKETRRMVKFFSIIFFGSFFFNKNKQNSGLESRLDWNHPRQGWFIYDLNFDYYFCFAFILEWNIWIAAYKQVIADGLSVCVTPIHMINSHSQNKSNSGYSCAEVETFRTNDLIR